MLYHKYNTEAFVLGGMPTGESSRYIYLFTKELGLVAARAQSARVTASKLRYALDDMSVSQVSLVRGKHTWRLTNAVPQKNLFLTFRDTDKHELGYLSARLLSTVKTLVAGEEANPKLYTLLSEAFLFMESQFLDPEDIKNLEAILMLRILDNLGYFGSHRELGVFVADTTLSRALLGKMGKERPRAVVVINNALRESHL